MILQDDFYTILHPVTAPGSIHAVLELNPGHAIFRGHFPDQPVVPGVCMLQMIKELLETATGKPARLLKGSELKFLSVIDPRQNKQVNVELIYAPEGNDLIAVTARLFYNETNFFKFKGIFTAE
jgi:3-hydroxyacyl-[acyl-carrier-protein] dehydratase